MVNSEFVVGIKLGDFIVVIGYQANELSHILFAGHFVVSWHIMMDSLARCQHSPTSILNHNDYSFLDPTVKD